VFKKIFLFSVFCLLGFVVSGCSQDSGLSIVEVGGQEFKVEIPQTSAARAKGLAGRENLAENKGMLFIFESAQFVSFWMKDMLIPLDFVWIREGEVVSVEKNIRPRDYQPPQTLTPAIKVDKVLELKAGTIDKYNIETGDKVNLLE